VNNQDRLRTMLEADKEYASHKFTFTFTRAEVSSIIASLTVCQELLDGISKELCGQVLAKIEGDETYKQSRRPARGNLS
jgi:hypothetical protein